MNKSVEKKDKVMAFNFHSNVIVKQRKDMYSCEYPINDHPKTNEIMNQ